MYRTMKRLSRLSAVGLVVALLGLVSPPRASADEPLLFRWSFTTVYFDECTGENIRVTGEFLSTYIIHSVGHTNLIDSHQTYVVHGTGVGQTSGRMYVYDEVLIYSAESAFDSPRSYLLTDKAVFRTRFIAQGAYPDLFAKFTLECVESPTDLTCTEAVESECHEGGAPSN